MAEPYKTESQKYTVKVEVPVGYRIIGYRTPVEGELYLSTCFKGRVVIAQPRFPTDTIGRFIVEKIVTYRKPVMPDDYGKEIEVGNTGHTWTREVLCGMRPNGSCVTEQRIWDHGRVEV